MKFFDLHCHILPGLDDGAFSLDETLNMAEVAARHGTAYIVCTPHIYPDVPYSLEAYCETYFHVSEIVKQAGLGVQLLPGQEIFFDEDYEETLELLEDEQLLTLNRSVYPLIEFDPAIHEEDATAVIGRIMAMGMIPIVAHPERYEFVAEDTERLRRMKQAGALLQVNKGSVTGGFGREAARIAQWMLRERLVDVAASDAHSPYRRTPILSEFHEWLSETVSMDYADYLLCTNPRHILRNEKTESYL